jgi:hypothetical protein
MPSRALRVLRALPLVGRSPPPRRRGDCVCLCPCVSACAGAVPPRSAVAHTTSRTARESPSPIAAKSVDVLSRAPRACVRCVGGSVTHTVSATLIFSCACAFGGVGGRLLAVASKMWQVPTIRSWVAEAHGRRIASAATWRPGAGARFWGGPLTPPRACESAGCCVANAQLGFVRGGRSFLLRRSGLGL